ncbi:ABC transporter substrate-binding protein [Azospirillum sp. ST 5-10]|uniref:ABC transporter substrate-binding protein n=1 Tax=unclassified Azospirillum TaxID=2630922 RepID=UPI003F49C3E7
MKRLVRSLLLGAMATLFSAAAFADGVPIRFTLDWKAQGPHAWFYLAKQKGYFAAEGLDVTVDQGEGSAAAVTRVMSGAYDAGFGDINALIQAAVKAPKEAPVMVYLVYNKAPFAIIAKAGGPVRKLADLEGKTIASPAGSATFKLFPALAEANGFDASRANVLNAAQNLIEQMLVRGEADAIAQFGPTSYMNFIAMGLDPDKDFTWFFYSDHGVDMYSNGVMVSQALLKKNPDAVKGLVKAINRAIMDVAADPKAGIDALVAVEPLTNPDLERRRMLYTLDNQMRTAETQALGLGALDPDRLKASIATLAKVYELPATPDAAAVFDASFLPPKAERMLPPAK